MTLRPALPSLLVVLGTWATLAACSSFGSAPAPGDAGVADDATPPGADAASDSSVDAPADSGPDSTVGDAASGCNTVVVDDFDGRSPNASWRLEPQGGLRDFSGGTAVLSIPAGEGIYSVLSTSAFKAAGGTAPARVLIDFDAIPSRLEAPGIVIAQLPGLTDGGNIRVDAVPQSITQTGGRPGMSLSLVQNGTAPPGPSSTLELDFGEIARIHLEYSRSGDELTVALSLRDRPGGLSLRTTAAQSSDSTYFQMGPFSNRGALTGMGASMVYDNVRVQACAR